MTSTVNYAGGNEYSHDSSNSIDSHESTVRLAFTNKVEQFLKVIDRQGNVSLQLNPDVESKAGIMRGLESISSNLRTHFLQSITNADTVARRAYGKYERKLISLGKINSGLENQSELLKEIRLAQKTINGEQLTPIIRFYKGMENSEGAFIRITYGFSENTEQ